MFHIKYKDDLIDPPVHLMSKQELDYFLDEDVDWAPDVEVQDV